MPISVDQIDEWRQLPKETEHIEFKEAKTQFDYTDLLRYCIAIANEGGGHLLLGIQNKIPRMIVATSAINDPGAMAEKIFNKLHFRVQVEAVAHPEGRVVVLSIPSRPMGRPLELDGAYWMRVNSSLVPMSPDQIHAIIAENNPEWSDEPSLTGLGSARVLDLLDTPVFFKLLDKPYPESDRGVIDKLLNYGLIEEKPMSASFAIRRLGAILLAKDLNQFPELYRKAARVIAYDGRSKIDTTRVDTTPMKGYASGFQDLVQLVSSHLPKRELFEKALRREIRMVPEIALREVIANALIHQDFNLGGCSVTIEIFQDRVQVTSPGDPLIQANRFIDSHRSRNERVAYLMRIMRICEERGSGVDRMVNAAEEHELPAPDFRAGEQQTIATIYGPQNFQQMDREMRMNACYLHCALKYLNSERMTNESLRERFRLSHSGSTVVSRLIDATMETKLIKLDQKAGTSRRFRRYLPFFA
jgi:ATP-dependent DNA helicase RecG